MIIVVIFACSAGLALALYGFRHALPGRSYLAATLLLILPGILLQILAGYEVAMALATNDRKYAFADMGFGLAMMFNCVWQPALWIAYFAGRGSRRLQ